MFRKFKKLRRKGCRFLCSLYDRPVPPPSDREKQLVEELRAMFSKFRTSGPEDCATSEKEWLENENRLSSLVLNDEPREFLRWDVMLKTMVVAYASYVGREFKYLKRLRDWDSRWRGVLEESPVGHPVPYWRYPKSSGNLIHHAYHWAQFEEKTGLRVDDVDFVFEFGGGYGSMCRLIHRLGFKGRYLLFDLPSFSALQRFFLKSTNMTVFPIESFTMAQGGIVCISELEQLTEILTNHIRPADAIFIGTWSVSEVPVRLRDTILALVSSFRAFLIAYQARFGEVDNIEFFRQWQRQQDDVEWQDWRIEQLPGHNRYLFGKRRHE